VLHTEFKTGLTRMPEQIAPAIALIGYGEAAATFARAAGWGAGARGWDLLAERRAAMSETGVVATRSAAEALAGASLVLSLVTADQALDAAQDYAQHLAPGALWCDMNSIAPKTKRAAAHAVEAAGGRYVDVAVLAPVDPGRLAVPLLLAGAADDEVEVALRGAGFTNLRVVGAQVGKASAIKLVRSIMVKGIEALTAEMMMAAHVSGVTDEVLASLDASDKLLGWDQRADYNLDRMLVHGERRSAEMYEASEMLRDLGISPIMTEGTVQWQEGLGLLGIADPPKGHRAKLAAITETPEFKNGIP
jgi:3-hydroxyisobutyrate dehydrogenase-like beta-hydroxyacid dehydrogenase